MRLLLQSGKYYSVNFPLQEGIDDNSFESIFKPVVNKVRPTLESFALPDFS